MKEARRAVSAFFGIVALVAIGFVVAGKSTTIWVVVLGSALAIGLATIAPDIVMVVVGSARGLARAARRKHHKQVEDHSSPQDALEQLRAINRHDEEPKASHRGGPARTVLDPTKPAEETLKPCLTGEQLWERVIGSQEFRPSWAAGLSDTQQKAVAALLDYLSELINIAPEMTYEEGRQAARSLGEQLNRLAKLGLIVGVRYLYLLKTGGVGEPLPWRSFEIKVLPAAVWLCCGGSGARRSDRREHRDQRRYGSGRRAD